MMSVWKSAISLVSPSTRNAIFKCTKFRKYRPQRLLHTSTYLGVDGIPVKMPSLSPTMNEGKIVKWLKQEGDVIQPGDVICDIETDKAVVSFEMEEEGTLAKILVGSDTESVNIGTLIALIAPEGEDWRSVSVPVMDGEESVSTENELAPSSSTECLVKPGQEFRKFGPSVRLLLELYALQPEVVPGSGPHGELLKGDVLQYISKKNLKPKPFKEHAPPAPLQSPAPTPSAPTLSPAPTQGPYTDIPVSNMRRTIAKRLTQSKTGIAHAYGTLECHCDGLLELRRELVAEGIKISVNDLIIKAVGAALVECPALNCVWEGDQLVQNPAVDIAVAVATPGGLITPIVRRVEALGVSDVGAQVRELAGRAKEGKLMPEEFMGGSFTISNLGMFGISEFSAIINPPQCGILAVGGTQKKLDADGKPVNTLRACLSYDSLAVSADDASDFLSVLTRILEDPQQIILGGRRSHALSQLL